MWIAVILAKRKNDKDVVYNKVNTSNVYNSKEEAGREGVVLLQSATAGRYPDLERTTTFMCGLAEIIEVAVPPTPTFKKLED